MLIWAITQGFQSESVKLASKQTLDKVSAYIEGGGKMLVCRPYVKTDGIDPTQDFHARAVVVGAASFVEKAVNANSSLAY